MSNNDHIPFTPQDILISFPDHTIHLGYRNQYHGWHRPRRLREALGTFMGYFRNSHLRKESVAFLSYLWWLYKNVFFCSNFSWKFVSLRDWLCPMQVFYMLSNLFTASSTLLAFATLTFSGTSYNFGKKPNFKKILLLLFWKWNNKNIQPFIPKLYWSLFHYTKSLFNSKKDRWNQSHVRCLIIINCGEVIDSL